MRSLQAFHFGLLGGQAGGYVLIGGGDILGGLRLADDPPQLSCALEEGVQLFLGNAQGQAGPAAETGAASPLTEL